MPSWFNKPDPFGPPPKSQSTLGNIGSNVGAVVRRAQNTINQAANAYQQSAYRPTPTPTPTIYSNSTGNYSRPVAPPSEVPGGVPDINAYLGSDTGYQNQIREFDKALQDFTADVLRRRGSLDSEFGLSKKALEDQRLLDLESIEDDFGARGLLRSGLYAGELGKYEKEYGERQSDLARRNNEAIASLVQEESGFKSQQELKKQAAKEAAVARRAAQYGI